jgi:ribose-phosphate pyrophosphokinase
LLRTDLSKGIKIFSGNANPALANEVAKHLDLRLGNITVGRFSDGEVNVQVNEHIRGKDVYLVQPTLPPVNETLMELLLMISTMRRASARKITAVIPYYGYARQDRKMQARVPISAADVARLLEAMGVDRVVSVDLHCGQIQVSLSPFFSTRYMQRNSKQQRATRVFCSSCFPTELTMPSPRIASPPTTGLLPPPRAGGQPGGLHRGRDLLRGHGRPGLPHRRLPRCRRRLQVRMCAVCC